MILRKLPLVVAFFLFPLLTIQETAWAEESLRRDDPRFTYESARKAFQTALPPQKADLDKKWLKLGDTYHPALPYRGTYYPDGKIPLNDNSFFSSIFIFESFEDVFGNPLARFNWEFTKDDSELLRRISGPVTMNPDFLSFEVNEVESCRQVISCKKVQSRELLLCSHRFTDHRRGCDPKNVEGGIYTLYRLN